MGKFFTILVLIAAGYFFFLFLPKAIDESKQQHEIRVQKASEESPKLQESKTLFGKIKRARLEGTDNRNVELVEYPNGLVCVKFKTYVTRGSGAGIDCDWSKYREKQD